MNSRLHVHPRTVGWFGTTAVAMGGINQSLFLIGALFIGQGVIHGQGSAAVPLLIAGLLLSWAATPGWTELILMYPNRVGGIAATCAEAFRPYSPVLANLTGVCYWWGWVPTCGLTALLSASAIHQWYLPWFPVPLMASGIVLFFTFISLCGVKWVMRLAMPIATVSAVLAFLSAVVPIFSGSVDWQRAFTFHLTIPFNGWFGQVTSIMAGLYLIGFAAPAFEQAACHVGETIDPNKNVPRAMFASAGLATLYFVVLPIVWLGALGPASMGKELALVLGPTFAPLLSGAAKATAIWFMIFNMLHGTIAALAGSSRTLAQLSEDGLLPEFLAKRSSTDAPWAATLLTAGMAIAFLLIGDPVWLIAAANLTYLIGIALPSVAVWLLRRNEPQMERPFRAPRGTIALGLFAASAWGLTAVLGFQQFGLPTVLVGIAFAYSGSALYAWRKFSDRRKMGLPGIARTLHLKLTGAMLLVLVLDAAGYYIAVGHVPKDHTALIAVLEDTFVIVALLTISVGLILPGMIAHSAVEVSKAADRLVTGTLADFTRAMRALASGDLDAAKADFDLMPVVVHSRDEVGDMAINFNRLQQEVGHAALGLEGARDGLSQARASLTKTNQRLQLELVERKQAEEVLRQLRNQHALILNSVSEGVHGIDHEGKIVFENPASAQLLGYQVSELLGREAHLTMHHSCADGSVYPRSECNIHATLKDGVVRHVEHEVFWRKDGTSLPVDYTSTPIRDGDGLIIGATVVFTDITKRKEEARSMRETHEELERRVADRTAQLGEAKDEAVRANSAKSEFLSRMSHELRTPMNAILGFAQLMDLEPNLSADQHESLDQILGAGHHLLNLINEVLDVTQIESGHMALVSEAVEVRNLLQETLDLVRPLAAKLNIAILNQGAEDVARFVLADRNRLKQTLLNILSNAIKYNRPGGHIKVKYAAQSSLNEARSDEMLRISVADTGVGLSPEKLARLFTPFDRLDAERTGIQGTGLGLALSKRMVELMGGTLGVESVVGQGSTFWIDLPLTEPVAGSDLLPSAFAETKNQSRGLQLLPDPGM